MNDYRSKENQPPMDGRPVKLLRAASEMLGGDEALAKRLGIDQALLSRLMAGQQELPERVLFGTVDIILANHEAGRSRPRRSASDPAPEAASDG